MAVNWKKLEHNAGAAVDVPKWIEYLVAGGDPHKYWSEIDAAFDAPGKWLSASAPTLDMLLAQAPQAKKPGWVLRCAADILGSDQARAWLNPSLPMPNDVTEIVANHWASLVGGLSHKDPIYRSATGFFLGAVPASQLESSTQALLTSAATEREPNVLASLLLALARSSASPVRRELERHMTNDHALVRGAAALALIRAFPEIAMRDVCQPLSDWLGQDVNATAAAQTDFWWFGRYRPAGGEFQCPLWRSGVALGMVLKAHAATIDEWTQALVALAADSDAGLVRRGISDALLVAFDFDHHQPEWALSPADLTERQRGLATMLANTRVLPAAGYGLCAMGAVRSRWLSLDPPAALEMAAAAPAAREPQPLYLVWKQWLESGDAWKNEIPPQLASLSGAQRWQAAVEYAAGAYLAGGKSYQEALVEREIESACADPSLKTVAHSVLDECARVVTETRAQGRPARLSGSTSALALVPALRAGLAWQPTWEVLLGLSNQCVALIREVLDVVPAAALEEWFWTNEHNLLVEANYADLFSSERLVKRVLEKAALKRQGVTKVPDVCVRLERLLESAAAKMPHVATTLDAYKAALKKPKRKS